jgi:hypothetical protein
MAKHLTSPSTSFIQINDKMPHHQRTVTGWGSRPHGNVRNQKSCSDGPFAHLPGNNSTWFEKCLVSNNNNDDISDSGSTSNEFKKPCIHAPTLLSAAQLKLKDQFKADLVSAETTDIAVDERKRKKKTQADIDSELQTAKEQQASTIKWAFTNLAMFYYDTSQFEPFLTLCTLQYLNMSHDSQLEGRVGKTILAHMEAQCGLKDLDTRLEKTLRATLHFTRGVAINAMAYDPHRRIADFVTEAVLHIQLAEACESISFLITQINARRNNAQETTECKHEKTSNDDDFNELTQRLAKRQRQRIQKSSPKPFVSEEAMQPHQNLSQDNHENTADDDETKQVDECDMLVNLVSQSPVDLTKAHLWKLHSRTHYILAMGIAISHMESSHELNSNELLILRKVAFSSMLSVASALLAGAALAAASPDVSSAREAETEARALIKVRLECIVFG